jgi:hypothetical protein
MRPRGLLSPQISLFAILIVALWNKDAAGHKRPCFLRTNLLAIARTVTENKFQIHSRESEQSL